MTVKPTYDELQKKVKELEVKIASYEIIEGVLTENKERFRLLYERAPLAYQSLDEKGRLLEVNQAWLKMMGYEKHEVIGMPVANYLSPEWRDHFKTNFPRFKSVGEVMGVEFELQTKEGIPILVSVNGRIGRDKEGNFQQTHCILYDITERDRADRIRDQVVANMQEMLAAGEKRAVTPGLCAACGEKLQK